MRTVFSSILVPSHLSQFGNFQAEKSHAKRIDPGWTEWPKREGKTKEMKERDTEIEHKLNCLHRPKIKVILSIGFKADKFPLLG